MKNTRKKQAGAFDVSPDHHIFGELTIAGSKTKLKLYSPDFFATDRIPAGCITGVLHDLTHVSLLGCITPRAPGSSSGPSGEYYFAKVLPHYVICGKHHLRPADSTITKAVLYLRDATKLFYDFDAYGNIFFDAEPLVQQLIQNEPHRKSQQTGPNARILYYTGHSELINASTSFGGILVERKPGTRAGGKREGGSLRDEVAISLRFDPMVTFGDALAHARRIVDYFGLLIGRPQDVTDFYLGTQESSSTNSLLDVETSYGRRSSKAPNSSPSSYDTLLDGIRKAAEFTSVMVNWLNRSESWSDARWRFFNSYAGKASSTSTGSSHLRICSTFCRHQPFPQLAPSPLS